MDEDWGNGWPVQLTSSTFSQVDLKFLSQHKDLSLRQGPKILCVKSGKTVARGKSERDVASSLISYNSPTTQNATRSISEGN